MFHKKGSFSDWFHGFGPGEFKPRFGRGDIKFVMLDLLTDKPRHGYEIIQEMEKRFHGFYTPSAGTVYPTLQLLEDEDFIKSNEKAGKKVYTITDTGKSYLEEHKEELEEMQERVHMPWGEKGELFHAIRQEIGQTAKLLFSNAAMGKLHTENIESIKVSFTKFREEINTIINSK